MKAISWQCSILVLRDSRIANRKKWFPVSITQLGLSRVIQRGMGWSLFLPQAFFIRSAAETATLVSIRLQLSALELWLEGSIDVNLLVVCRPEAVTTVDVKHRLRCNFKFQISVTLSGIKTKFDRRWCSVLWVTKLLSRKELIIFYNCKSNNLGN